MRRGFVIASLGLLLAGLELSTEAVSLVFARLRAGTIALLAGVEFQVGGTRFVVGVLFLVAGLLLAALTLWSAKVWKGVVRVGRACPQCGDRTRRVKRRGWHRLLSILMGEDLSRRSCEHCGWSGLSLTH